MGKAVSVLQGGSWSTAPIEHLRTEIIEVGPHQRIHGIEINAIHDLRSMPDSPPRVGGVSDQVLQHCVTTSADRYQDRLTLTAQGMKRWRPRVGLSQSMAASINHKIHKLTEYTTMPTEIRLFCNSTNIAIRC